MSDVAFHLISTPCPFLFQFSCEHFSIEQVALAGDAVLYGHAGPFEHHFAILIVPLCPGGGAWLIDAEDVVALLSLFFGKRVVHHGPIHLGGFWTLPDLLSARPNPYYDLPLYGTEHQNPPSVAPDYRLLQEINHRFPSLRYDLDHRPDLLTSARCYAESLRLLPIDRELAYVRLIQAVEAIADRGNYSDDERFGHDRELQQHLQWLAGLDDPHARRMEAFLRGRLYQTKRTVWLWLRDRLDSSFFTTAGLREGTVERAVKAAYDLRSAFVHRGTRFGDWVDPVKGRCHRQETVPDGFPETCPEPDLRRLLERSPSYLGLERLVRYTLHAELRRPL